MRRPRSRGPQPVMRSRIARWSVSKTPAADRFNGPYLYGYASFAAEYRRL